jgi:hypothetical protein
VRKRALQCLSIAAFVLVLGTVRDAQAQARSGVVAVRPEAGEFDLAQYSLVGNEAVRSVGGQRRPGIEASGCERRCHSSAK